MALCECGRRRQHRLRNVQKLIKFLRNQFQAIKGFIA